MLDNVSSVARPAGGSIVWGCDDKVHHSAGWSAQSYWVLEQLSKPLCQTRPGLSQHATLRLTSSCRCSLVLSSIQPGVGDEGLDRTEQGSYLTLHPPAATMRTCKPLGDDLPLGCGCRTRSHGSHSLSVVRMDHISLHAINALGHIQTDTPHAHTWLIEIHAIQEHSSSAPSNSFH